MELTTSAIKSLLSRARGNLRDILQPYVTNGAMPGKTRNQVATDQKFAPESTDPLVECDDESTSEVD